MRFAEPLAFLALILVPLLIVAHFVHERRLERRIRRAGDPDLVDAMSSLGAGRGRSERGFQMMAGALALALVAIALARPQFGLRTEVRTGRGMDLVLALDLSRSMLARDVVPSRLERARAELAALIEQLPGDRVGLVGFTSVAIPLCPLTVDHAALQLQLTAAGPDEMPRGGTSVAQAIEAAKRMLETSPKNGGAKAILIITDGEEHQGQAQVAAAEAKKAGIEVHVAGVGSRTGEPIPIAGSGRGVTGYLKDGGGQTIITRLNEAALRAVAQAGGGLTALPGTTGGLDLTPVRFHLSKQKKAELEERTVRVYEERYRWVLVPALILLMLATLIRPRRASKLALPLVAVFFLAGAGPFERPDSDVRAGNDALTEGRAEDAVAAYDRARERLAADPRLAYNRGLAQAAAGEIDAAVDDFKSALAGSTDPTVRSQANLAMANALRQKGSLKEAIGAYQQALLDDPKNIAARRNLEISRAMKRIQDLQPKQENPDGEKGEGDKGDEDEDKKEQGDGGVGDGGAQQPNDPEGGRDGGVGEAGQPPPEQPGDGGTSGDAGATPPPGEAGDAGAGEDAASSGAPEEPQALDQQDVQQLLDALQEREKVLQRKRLMQRYGTQKVEKDW